MNGPERARLPRIDVVALVLDAAILAFAVSAALIFITGGEVLSVGPVRISARSAWRPLLFAGLLGALRALVRRHALVLGGLLALVAGFLQSFQTDLRGVADVATPASRTRTRWAIGGLLLATVLMLRGQLAHMDSVPDPGDPLFSTWRLAWVAHQLVTDPLHLFDANIFFPARYALAYSDSIVLPGIVAAPFIWAGIHPLYVYNGMFIATFFLSGVAMFVLCRELTGHDAAAFIGALLFGFYPYRFEHYSHLELQITLWVPLAVLMLKRALATGRMRYGMLLGAMLAGQAWSCMYYGLMLPLYLAPVGLMMWVGWRCPIDRLKILLVAVLVFVAVGGPLAYPYLKSHAERGDRDMATALRWSAHTSDYLEAHDRSALYARRMHSRNARPERQLFPGFSPVVLALAAFWPPLSIPRLAGAAGLIVAADTSLGLNGFTFGVLYTMVPPFRGLRSPARFSIFVGFSLALLAAYGARRLMGLPRRPGARSAVTALLAIGVLVDLAPNVPLEKVPLAPPPVYASLTPDAVLAEFPFPTVADFDRNIIYMYYSVFHWARLVNGYSGSSPLSYHAIAAPLTKFPSRAAFSKLRSLGVTHLTYTCAPVAALPCDDVLRELDQDQRLSLVSRARGTGGTVSLYRLVEQPR